MYFDDYEINSLEESNYFSKYDDAKDEDNATSVPAQLVFGVTLTLCGLFLMMIPIPVCKPWGERMITSGVVVCGNCISSHVDERKKISIN